MWNLALESGGVLVGDDVQITIELELTRKVAAPWPLAGGAKSNEAGARRALLLDCQSLAAAVTSPRHGSPVVASER